MTAPDQPSCFDLDAGWHGAPLQAGRLVLRRWNEADVAELTRLAGDAAVARWTAHLPHPLPAETVREFYRGIDRRMAAGEAFAFVIARRLDGQVVGGIGFDLKDGAAKLGYWIGRPHWGQGYATEAVRRLLRLVFRQLGLARAEGQVMIGNPASARVLEKAGFALTAPVLRCDAPARGGAQPAQGYTLDRAAWEAAWAARPLVLVAAVALIDPDGRVLLAQRPAGKPLAGLWEFPGGKVQPGETPETALIRELDEELGIDVRESCLAPLAFASHDYDHFHLLMPLYACRSWKGAVTAREGQALAWARAPRLGDYPMPPADLPLVALLQDWL